LGANPLGAGVGVQLSIHLVVVEDAGVVESAGLARHQRRVLYCERTIHTLTMRLPGKVAPSRHMVEPQSPLQLIRRSSTRSAEYIPEVGDNFVTAIRDFLVLLRSALGDLEAVVGENGVAGVGASADFAAVDTMAENLVACQTSA
jgi:hypothetical protein